MRWYERVACFMVALVIAKATADFVAVLLLRGRGGVGAQLLLGADLLLGALVFATVYSSFLVTVSVLRRDRKRRDITAESK